MRNDKILRIQRGYIFFYKNTSTRYVQIQLITSWKVHFVRFHIVYSQLNTFSWSQKNERNKF